MEKERVKQNIREALKSFITRDRDKLLSVKIYEPTLSHRIAVYLENLFEGYDVDCEYNKFLDCDKKQSNGENIRPDIIIHRRQTSTNLAIIEVKKNGINSQLAKDDISKLGGCMEGTLHYDLGLFIGILKRKIDLYWLEKVDGEIIGSYETLK